MSTVRETVWREDFADGFDLSRRWAIMTMDDFAADDGAATVLGGQLRVVPSGTNATTGEPAFTKDGTGPLGRMKWFASTQRAFETTAGPIRVAFRAGCRAFGIDPHPYGDAVANAATDLRLAAFVLNVMDSETGMVFDFAMSDGAIYPLHERIALPSGAEPFASIHQPVLRARSDVHDLAIEIDAAAGTAAWEVDGTVAARVGRIGVPEPGWTTMIQLPGTRQPSAPARVVVSLGLFTLPDAAMAPSSEGLVDLGLPYRVPRRFAGGPTLFGQGIEGVVKLIEVSRG